MENLKKEFESIVSKIVKEFENKQDVYFEFFVSDDFSGVACFSNEYYFSLDNICHDIFTNQPKGLIIEWNDDCLENQNKNISYFAYSKGLRFNKI